MMTNEEKIDLIQQEQHGFHPVVPFNASEERLCKLDFTSQNKNLNATILNDTDLFSAYITRLLHEQKAKFGIGGYAEHRTIYQRSKVFDTEDAEPRRLHLGIDIWGEALTPVMAPLDGMVHSFAFHGSFGNYGTTIILQHQIDAFSFYTLYGHLNLAALKNLSVNQTIKKGTPFAAFGIPSENGYWPPHLHFQIIFDMENYEGDFPGVCQFSKKDQWLAQCPDPDIILQLNQYVTT